MTARGARAVVRVAGVLLLAFHTLRVAQPRERYRPARRVQWDGVIADIAFAGAVGRTCLAIDLARFGAGAVICATVGTVLIVARLRNIEG